MIGAYSHKKMSFEKLYLEFFETIFSTSFSITKNREDAQDMTHDILLKINDKLDLFKGDSSLKSWIIAITRNHCIDYFRKEQNFRYSSISDANDLFEDVSDNLTGVDLSLYLSATLNQLNDTEKKLIVLKYFEKTSIKDIQKISGLGESAIKMKLKRTREKMNKIIIDQLRKDHGKEKSYYQF